MMNYNARAISICTLVLVMPLGGCTTSLSSRADTITNSPAYGIAYSLPALQYKIVTTWTLSKCDPITKGGPTGYTLPVEFETAVEVKSESVEGESRIIDYRELTGPFKTGHIKVDFHEDTGFVKQIGAGIEGQEAKALGGAIKLGLGIGRIALGLPGSPAGGGVKLAAQQTACTPAVRTALDQMDEATVKLKGFAKRASDITLEMATLKVKALLDILSDADRIQLSKLVSEAETLEKNVKEYQEKVAQLTLLLSYTEEFVFPAPLNARAGDYQADSAKVKKWLGALLSTDIKSEDIDRLVDLQNRFSLHASLTPKVAAQACAANACMAEESVGGFAYRKPIQADLTICRSENIVTDPLPGAGPPTTKPVLCAEVLHEDVAMVPQMGVLHVLPLKSGWGENNDLSAVFSKGGMLTSVEYKALSAPGVAAIDAANDAVTGVGGLLGAISDKREQAKKDAVADAAAAKKDEIDAVQHQIDLITKQADLANLRDPKLTADAASLAALNARVALLRLEKEEAELIAARDKAKAGK